MEETEFVPVITDGKIADSYGRVYDLHRTVAEDIPVFMMVVLMLTLVVAIFLMFQGIRRYKGHFPAFLIGIGGYVYFGYIVNTIVMIVISMISNQAFGTTESEVALVISSFIMSGVTVLGMYFTALLMRSKYTAFADVNVMQCGFGFAMVVPALIDLYLKYVVVLSLNQKGGFENLLEGEDAADILDYAVKYDFLFYITKTDLIINAVYNLILITVVVYSAVIIFALVDKRVSMAHLWIVVMLVTVMVSVNSLLSYGYLMPQLGLVIALVVGFVYIRFIMVFDKKHLGNVLKPLNNDSLLEDPNPYSKKSMDRAYKKNKKLWKKK